MDNIFIIYLKIKLYCLTIFTKKLKTCCLYYNDFVKFDTIRMNNLICPKCKAKVSSGDTHCPNCNLRLIFKCPKCGSPTRLGSVSCAKCGHTFVKFCPKCRSANYATSLNCRKCNYDFNQKQDGIVKDTFKKEDAIKKVKANNQKVSARIVLGDAKTVDKRVVISSNEQNNEKVVQKSQAQASTPLKQAIENFKVNNKEADNKTQGQTTKKVESTFLVYIDFLNIEKTFDKFSNEEFEQKVNQNIKTTIKIAFGAQCDFVTSRLVMFRLKTSNLSRFKDKLFVFESEFLKFNQILEKSLDIGLNYKFIITTPEEVKANNNLTQLKLGADKDVIVSNGAYTSLKNEISLIKIAPDSYKMIFLESKPTFEQQEEEKYDKALEKILNTLSDSNSKIQAISVNANRGSGKTHLLNDVYYRIEKNNKDNVAIFYAQCSALTQIGSYGLIQSFFMSLLGYPLILKDELNLKVFERRILDALKIDKIGEEILETLANLIYPLKKDYFENILINKEITFKYLKEVFDYVKETRNVIFIIDDFDLIDESSFGFIKYLVENDYFDQDTKMLLSYKNKNSVAIYFQTNKLTNAQCLNISLKNFNLQESKEFVKRVIGENAQVPDEILSQIAYNAQGNIAYIEQILQYMFERKILTTKEKIVVFSQNDLDIILPDNIEKCFNERLEFLKEQNELEYRFLSIASLLGDKLDYQILSSLFSLSENDFFDIVCKLEKKGYFKRKADDIYGFKNSLTWSYCYIKAKEEEIIKSNAQTLLEILQSKVVAIPLICPILAQIINNKELAYTLWTKSLRTSSFIGDINIYSMAQKQSLILLDSVRVSNLDYVKNNICERLGKLIYKKNPQEARDYLTNSLMAAQKNGDVNKVVDLSGYLVKSTFLSQDYTGVIEIVDNVIKYFDQKDRNFKKSEVDLQLALIKTRKLPALLKLGYWEDIASVVNTEIMPVMQKQLNFFSKHKWIGHQELFLAWIESNIILAQSYSQQGSPLAFELIDELNRVIQKEKNLKIDNLKIQLAYAQAMANTARGYIDESSNILEEIVKDYSYIIDTPELVCEWNIIKLINKILKMDIKTIKEELFEATTYANNFGDEVSKNIFKTLLAYVFLEEKSYLKAIEIATNEMQYFSTKKIAFGAMLAWYISAAATTNNKADTYCIEICEKAVKICENAQNNNFYFKVLFQELLAKCYLKLNDYENAIMYCDLAIQTAISNELLYLQARLENLRAEIAREKLPQQSIEKKRSYAQNVIKMYNKSIELSRKLNLTNYVRKVEKDLISFRAYCQLNRIIEEKQ